MGRRRQQTDQTPQEYEITHGAALSADAREREVIAAAYDLAEKQIREGTASAMVITHFLKLGSTRERLERQIMEAQAKLVQAKTESIESDREQDQRYAQVIAAMRKYQGIAEDAETDAYIQRANQDY